MSREDSYHVQDLSRWEGSDAWYGTDEQPDEGDGDDSLPWDFPPGSPGFGGGPEVPQEFLSWLRDHDDRMVVGWHPATKRHTIWRRKDDGTYSLMTPVQNPFDFRWCDLEPGEAIPVLDQRIKALLIDSHPDSYGGEKALSRYVAQRMEGAKTHGLDKALDIMRDTRRSAQRFVQVKIGYGRSRGDKVASMYQ